MDAAKVDLATFVENGDFIEDLDMLAMPHTAFGSETCIVNTL